MVAQPLRFIKGGDVRFWRPAGAVHLRAEIAGDRTILSARVKRVFPLSNPNGFLSIQDDAEKEVGIVESIEEFETESRKLVAEELDRRYFTPRISRIDQLKQDAGMWKFNVETQRGTAEFYVRNWRDSAHETAAGRWQINSVDGQRFEIESVEALDGRSQALLEQLL